MSETSSATEVVAWFHCFAGIAGDMALGSLVDAGADALQERGQALLHYVRRTLVPGELVSEMERRRVNLEGMLDEAIERTLRRLRIPSRHDIDEINQRLDKLQDRVNRSDGRAESPRKTARRK